MATILARRGLPISSAISLQGMATRGDVGAGSRAVDHGGIDDQRATRLDHGLVLIQGRQVHHQGAIRIFYDRRTDLLVGNDHRAVGRAAADLRTIGGDSGDFLARVHGCVRHDLAGKHDALAAETRKDDLTVHIFLLMSLRRDRFAILRLRKKRYVQDGSQRHDRLKSSLP